MIQETIRELVLLVVLTTMTCSGGVIPLGHGGDDGSLHHGLTQSHATSFVHFHGPVEGPVFEVKVPHIPQHEEYGQIHGQQHQHGDNEEYTVDYVAQPKYEFSYGVEDHHTGDFHGQKESRDGKTVKGEYSIQEPGGNVRTVKYHADKDGFHAVVHNSGSNDHSGGVYGGHLPQVPHHEEHQNLHLQGNHQVEQNQEYEVYQSQGEDLSHQGYL